MVGDRVRRRQVAGIIHPEDKHIEGTIVGFDLLDNPQVRWDGGPVVAEKMTGLEKVVSRYRVEGTVRIKHPHRLAGCNAKLLNFVEMTSTGARIWKIEILNGNERGFQTTANEMSMFVLTESSHVDMYPRGMRGNPNHDDELSVSYSIGNKNRKNSGVRIPKSIPKSPSTRLRSQSLRNYAIPGATMPQWVQARKQGKNIGPVTGAYKTGDYVEIQQGQAWYVARIEGVGLMGYKLRLEAGSVLEGITEDKIRATDKRPAIPDPKEIKVKQKKKGFFKRVALFFGCGGPKQ